ncbi:MAG: rhodanese-like domain-containing protein [Ignavibacteriales bacterium]|nr:MAG: rhodanese-like domain-containing protein [Ignavibacteriales bacterium]
MSDNLIDLNPKEFSNKLREDDNAVLLDIRTPNEYNQGHIPNAVLMNIYDPSFADEIQMLDKKKNYYLYCRSGNRSYHAGRMMVQFGFNKIYNLSSGILDWNEPLQKDRE